MSRTATKQEKSNGSRRLNDSGVGEESLNLSKEKKFINAGSLANEISPGTKLSAMNAIAQLLKSRSKGSAL